MSNTKNAGVAITERDKSLLRYLFVNKVATVEDIRQDIFNHIGAKTVHRRLVKLSRIKLIEAVGQREHGNRMIYFLTKKGFRGYIADEGVISRVQLKSDCVEHDLTLLAIKRRLRTLNAVASVYSENLIRSGLIDGPTGLEMEHFKELRPDAVVKVNIQDKLHLLPLEYEATGKSPRRNAKLLAKYVANPRVAGVLFISKVASIEKKMRHQESRGSPQMRGKFYYCTLEKVLNFQGSLPLSNLQNETLSLA